MGRDPKTEPWGTPVIETIKPVWGGGLVLQQVGDGSFALFCPLELR